MCRPLGTFCYVMVGSPAYFVARGTPGQSNDLGSHACLRYRYPSTGKLEEWALRHDGEGSLGTPSVTAVASMVEPLIAMAEDGLGIICVPDFAVRQQLKDGTLFSVLPEAMCGVGVINALWPNGREGAPKVGAFVETLAKHLFPGT